MAAERTARRPEQQDELRRSQRRWSFRDGQGGRTAPYLHHGAVPSLEVMFDPAREEPGHEFGLDLSESDRQALLAFLESI